MSKKTISIGIICYNEEANIALCHKGLSKIASLEKKYFFEFIFSDNGSTDNTRAEIRKIAQKDPRVVGVILSRNFGPESNSEAALDHAKGDAFILYEADMQDPPEVILEFINRWEKGADVVVGVRAKIEDSLFMTFIRKTYYKIFRTISSIEVPVNAGSYALLDKKVMVAIRQLPEKYRFYRGLRAWVGFKTSYVTYNRRRRARGNTSYNFLNYIHHAERSFFGFSYLPLDIIVYLGLLLVIVAFIWIVGVLVLYFLLGQVMRESMFIVLSIVFFGGVQLLALSIIGKYVQVIVEETKNRPVYITKEVIKHH